MYTEDKHSQHKIDLQAEFGKQLQRIVLEKSRDFEKSLQDIARREGELLKRKLVHEAVRDIMNEIFSIKHDKSFSPPPNRDFSPIINWLRGVWR
jgi:hypothetical protein